MNRYIQTGQQRDEKQQKRIDKQRIKERERERGRGRVSERTTGKGL